MRPHYDAVLVTQDSALRAAVTARCPDGARLLCVDPAEAPDYTTIQTRRWWVDVDSTGPLPATTHENCDFFTQQDAATRSLHNEVVTRGSIAGDFTAWLWSRLDPTPQDARSGLPEWSLDLQEVELARLLQTLVAELPARLGYQEALVYLADNQTQSLRLGKSNVRSEVMLEIPLDGQAVLADAVRRALVIWDGQSLAGRGPAPTPLSTDESVLTLRHDDELLGVVHLRRHTLPRAGHAPSEILALTKLVSKLIRHARAYERVRDEARIDALTGLYNQRWMQEAVGREILRARRYGAPLSVMLLDLDALKRTNDAFGHRVGDDLLRHTADRIQRCLRQIDAAARTGGDEFVILLPRTDMAGAKQVADRIRQDLRREPPTVGHRALSARASIGVVQWQPDQDAAQLLDAADGAMYRAKQAGGDRVASGPAPVQDRALLAASSQGLRH